MATKLVGLVGWRGMVGSVLMDRMQAEGRADSEPLAPNDTPAGRARNRRVDVTLFVSAGG